MRTERSPIFSNGRRASQVRPVSMTRGQESTLTAARNEYRFLDTISAVVDTLRQRYPNQVRASVAGVAARQWVDFYRSNDESVSTQTALRAFERWKTRMRELDFAVDPGPVEEGRYADLRPIDENEQPLPVFLIDTTAAEKARTAARARLDELEQALGRAVREVTTAELAEELDTSPITISNWVQDGLPFTRSKTGKGRTMLFNLEEVKNWIRQYGSSKAKGMLAALITPEELTRTISESSSMTEARGKLGLSDSQFRELRRSLGVYVPVPAAERTSSWEVVKPEELVAALERHEGRREPIAKELGFSLWELREAFKYHGLLEHPFVVRPRSWDRPLPFTKEELEASITKHAGRRDLIADELGVSRGLLRDVIIDLDLLDHPMLQAGKVPASVSLSLREREATGAGRGSPGVVTAKSRGHQHGFARETTLVPFWLAAIREVMARHPGRGGGRATAAELGVSPVTLTNVIQGKRVPGYEVMEQIMKAAGRPVPDWQSALAELVDQHRSDVERARDIALPLRSLDAVCEVLELAPHSIRALYSGTMAPSMQTIQKILEAVGQPYLVESIATPETVAYGGRAEPPGVAAWRRTVAGEILRVYRTSGLSWSPSVRKVGADEGSVLDWSKQARKGFGPFVEAVQEDPSLLPLPPHLRVGAPEPGQGVKYGPWASTP